MVGINAPFEELFFEEYYGQRWEVTGDERVITWNTPREWLFFPGFGFVPIDQITGMEETFTSLAFSLWDDALDSIEFRRVSDDASADVSIGQIAIDGDGGILGIWDATTSGDIVTSAAILMDTATGTAFATAVLHEIGNVLGLGDIAANEEIRSVMEDPLQELYMGGSLWDDDVALIRRYYGEDSPPDDPEDDPVDEGPAPRPGPDDEPGGGSPGGGGPRPSPSPTSPEGYIVGTVGQDDLYGTAGDDRFLFLGGFDTITGGEGNDILFVRGDIEDYTLHINDRWFDGKEARLSLTGNSLESVHMGGIEAIAFDDGNAFFEEGVIDFNALKGIVRLSDAAIDSLIEMYVAYFDRAPDAVGLSYWGTRLADGMSMVEIAESFFAQPETRALYPSEMENSALVRTAYNNYLGRDPDQAGWEYWTDELNSGLSRGSFMLSLISGAYGNDDPVALADVATIQAKADIGLYFGAVKGLNNTDMARAAMEIYDRGDEATFRSAVSYIETAAARVSGGGDDAEFLLPMEWILEDRSYLDWI